MSSYSADQLAALIRSAMDAVICIDSDQRITLFNAAAEKIFGISAADALGGPLEQFLPARFRGIHHGLIANFGQHGSTSRRMGEQRVLLGLRSNGEEFPIEASISRAHVADEVAFSVILRDVSERVAAAKALEHATLEVQTWSRIAMQAREEEKSRMAREIHDELGQKMTALKLDLQQLKSELPNPTIRQSESLRRMQHLLDETVANTRRIAADLRPLLLDDLGLCAALEWQVQQFLTRNDIQCELLVDPELDRLPTDVASHIFRIVQEALNNVVKHAFARNVMVQVIDEGDAVGISVSDDGIGLQEQSPSSGSKRGIMGIRERAYALGGFVEIENVSPNGLKIYVHLPYQSLGPH